LTPEEDSIALTVMTADGRRLAEVFGQRRHFYAEQGPLNPEWRGNDIWKKALAEFTQKLVRLHNRQLVLKSPSHAVHLPDILEVFPDARFVTIFRNPFDQNRSLRTRNRTVHESDWCALQTRTSAPDDQLSSYVNRFLTSYFRTRELIPRGNLLEVTYESLVASPLETLRSIHENLGIPGMEALATRLENDTGTEQYQNNRHSELTPAEQEQLRRVYAPLFAAGYYTDILKQSGTSGTCPV
jgi:omega-hydroxy-beta-dihydromenaquinone-9 sulfotransferase